MNTNKEPMSTLITKRDGVQGSRRTFDLNIHFWKIPCSKEGKETKKIDRGTTTVVSLVSILASFC